jgi:phage terminase large subunit-like protein
MKEAILAVHALYPIDQVAYDPGPGGSWLADWIAEEIGIDITLGWSHGGTASAVFLEAFHHGELEHVRDHGLTTQILNVVNRYDDGRVWFDRPAEGRTAKNQRTRRIDAAVAAAMAVYVVKLFPPADEPFALWIGHDRKPSHEGGWPDAPVSITPPWGSS